VVGPVLMAWAMACGFALSTSIQHRAAATAPESAGERRGGLLRYLLTDPGWLLGVTVGAVAWGFRRGAGEALTSAGNLAAAVVILAAARRRDTVRAFMPGTAAGVLFGP
jgi:hypothetical protein